MSYRHLELQRRAPVLHIALNRPKKRNSLNKKLVEELLDAIHNAEQDNSTRAILLSANGEGFCAGQDLNEAVDITAQEVGAIVRERCNRLAVAIRESDLPFVCAVHGIAAGAGSSLALCCDIVVAEESARFRQAFINIGLLPDTGATYFLPRLVGHGRAAALSMLGEDLSAEQAAAMGLICEVTPAETLLERGYELAEKLCQRPARALALTKRALNRSFSNSLREQLELEAELQTHLAGTEDFREGIRAFVEKREPRFK